MFEISFLLAIYYIILNLILPFLAWIMFLWIFFWNKFKGFLLYLFSWFSWVWVIFFSIFNFQFFHFWVWKIEYFILLILLIIIFSARLKIKWEKIKDYIDSFKLKFSFSFFKKDFLKLTKIEKVFFSICTIFLVFFVSLSFAHTLSFPNYFDDSFGNWNTPAMNIFYDGGFKLFWDKTEILWHGRLGYPIYVPIYKAIITDFVWYWNDIYSNIFQYFIFLFLVFFTILISYKHTKNLFYAILPATLITWLPLVYFHTLEWYLELTSATYAVLTIYSFYKFLEKKDYDFIILWTLFWIILSHIKNDWIIVYLPWIICSFLIILLLKKEFVSLFKNLIKKENIYRFLFMIFFLFLPFLLIKAYYGIWFNQAAWEESAVWIEKIHTEIFPIIKHIFINQDNYNIVLVFVVLLFVWFFNNKNEKKNNLFILLSFILTFIIIILVFLLTSNYRFVMDQTTVNRVFTMIFVILFSFSSYLLAKKHD
jgi:hypothetical protein